MKPRGVALLGATGSIGRAALNVIARHRDQFSLRAVVAHRRVDELAQIVASTGAPFVGLVEDAVEAPRDWARGAAALVDAVQRDDVDIVINAVVGAAGLDATLAALLAGKRVALANKESLVVGGHLVLEAARRGGGEIIPVDSEHSAILQCIGANPARSVRRLVLTASGGPFRTLSSEALQHVTAADALRHPTWAMGPKITVDSATLANKALEVIEAHYLFDIPYENIDVVVHPQSIVHSLVEFVDGSVIAQLGQPTMELPLLYALTAPERLVDTSMTGFDPIAASPLTFEAVRDADFPALQLGRRAGRRGGAAPAVFNAANEESVAQFLAGRMRFVDIARCVAEAVESLGDHAAATRDDLMAADQAARLLVAGTIKC